MVGLRVLNVAVPLNSDCWQVWFVVLSEVYARRFALGPLKEDTLASDNAMMLFRWRLLVRSG